MKRLVLMTVMALCLTFQAQAASVAEAAQLAKQLGSAQEFPRNVQLRFQVLAARMDAFNGKKAPEQLLGFFSDTRDMVWSRPVNPTTEQTMRSLEQQMVELARQKGRTLDLPPVGYSPTASGPPSLRLLSSERATANGLSNLVLQTEQLATEVLGSQNSAELLFLRDNLTRLRQDLEDGTVSSNNVRSVLGARARFLVSGAAVNADPRLMTSLTSLAEVLQSNFTPETLRQANGGDLTL